ncbi:MAG: Shedu immune nuclease family protein [Saprospiraceae bacterium]|nr:Shedu immune nuclease family protein [Saprospiraceae bacterium]
MAKFEYFTKPTDEAIIQNSRLEQLYNHEFEQGRFFQVVFEDTHEVHFKLAPRTMMKVVYLADKDDIEGLEIVKLIDGAEKQKVKFSAFNFQQLRTFLQFISSIDLKGVSERRIALADGSMDVIDEDTRKKITTLLSGNEGSELIKELLDAGVITGQDLVNTGYRKQQLEIFHRLLFEGYMPEYKRDVLKKPGTKDETAWQLFFDRNPWIFGYGLSYRFLSILQREFSASDTTAAGKDEVISDFLLGDPRFTTFVELKKPDTPLFDNNKNRSGSWCLSEELIWAVSQILEQKASGQLKIETTKELLDTNDQLITQHACDPKIIIIIGCWDQVERSADSPGIKAIKRKTFELFRRDSRNIEIITYDELYERARFIVKNGTEHAK